MVYLFRTNPNPPSNPEPPSPPVDHVTGFFRNFRTDFIIFKEYLWEFSEDPVNGKTL